MAKMNIQIRVATGSNEVEAVKDIILVLLLYFVSCFLIMKLISQPILRTSAMPMIIKLAVNLLKSTNWCSVDLDKYLHFQNITSALRTKLSLIIQKGMTSAHKVIVNNSKGYDYIGGFIASR